MRSPTFAVTTLEEDFKALGIGVPRKRALVETGMPFDISHAEPDGDEPEAEGDDVDVDAPAALDPKLPKKEAVLPPGSPSQLHPKAKKPAVGAPAAEEPPRSESKGGRLEALKQKIASGMYGAEPDGDEQEAANDAEIAAGQDDVDSDALPPENEGDDMNAEPDGDEPPAVIPALAKKKTEASKPTKKWKGYGAKAKGKSERKAPAKKMAGRPKAKAKSGKRLHTGMDRISNLIESVGSIANAISDDRMNEQVKGFANIALISDLLDRGFRKLSSHLEDKELVPVARNFAEMGDDAAAIATDLDKAKKGEKEPELDDEEVDEAFNQMMSMMLDGVDLYDAMVPQEWSTPGGEGDDEDPKKPATDEADGMDPNADPDAVETEGDEEGDDGDASGNGEKPKVGEPGYEQPNGKKEGAPPFGAADGDDGDDDDDDGAAAPPFKKKGESAPGAVGAASTKPGKDREEDDDGTDPVADADADLKKNGMPSESRSRIKEMKALLGKGPARG